MKIFIKIIAIFSIAFVITSKLFAVEEIKIGLLVPISGKNKEIGESIVKSTRLAINKIGNQSIKIFLKDTASDPQTTFQNAKKLQEEGINIIIGPVFNKNLIYLEELKDITFLSLTNKMIDNPKNIISAGINSTSQLKTIIKFQKLKNLNKTIFLIPKKNYKQEIEKAISKSKIKTKNIYYYDTDPTKLTNQIEKITKYSKRKRSLKKEIEKMESINENNSKNKIIKKLKKKDTLGKINFDSIIIADFDESLKSVTTSLVYTDVFPKDVYFLTLNQWFDESLLKEKSLQPIYFPSINKENYDEFRKKYYKQFEEYPNQISFLSYDLVGLIYYLVAQNDFAVDSKIFLKKNMFKGKVGNFEIKDNRISHILNFYKVENEKFKKIF